MTTRARKSSGSRRVARRVKTAGKRGTISRKKIARAVREVSSRKR